LFPHGANSATVFQQISPIATTYIPGIGNDFKVISLSAPADVTGVVHGGIGDGCQSADFGPSSIGRIALMVRGGCEFGAKMQNAAAAGAVGALVYNTPTGLDVGATAVTQQTILGLFLRSGLGLELELLSDIAVVRMFADLEAVTPPQNPVPLPAALPLFATGLGALGWFGWRRKRTRAT
jgi:hypothetical protein